MFSITEISNKTSLLVNGKGGSISSPEFFGREKNVTPNYPTNETDNAWWFNESIKHKAFGSICVGRNNELWLVTRVSNSHGTGGGDLYWSVSYDEGNTWATPTKFVLDTATGEGSGFDPEHPGRGSSEDLRDATIQYDVLSDRYYLIYTHQYSIKKNGNNRYTDYSAVDGKFKCYVGYEPFVTMYDISMEQANFPDSPHALGDIAPGDCGQQQFGGFVRIGEYLYLPFYYWSFEDEQHTTHKKSDIALYRLIVNDHDPLSQTYYAYQWESVKVWEDFNGDNEVSFYISYNNDGTQRFNMLIRAEDDKGYHTYSDDGGITWSAKTAIGFDTAGGPTVYHLKNGFILFSREQSLRVGSSTANVQARYSADGQIWEQPVMISDCSSGYVTLASLESGKTLICYSKESGNIGIQSIREFRNY